MKKILVLIPSFPVPTETFIERELAYLAKDPSYDIQILCQRKMDGYLSQNLEGKVEYRKIRWTELPSLLISFAQNVVKYRSSIFSVTRELGANSKKKANLKYIYFLAKFYGFYLPWFNSYKPDFVIAHFMSEPSTVCAAYHLVTKIPFGVMAHARDVFLDGEYFETKMRSSRFVSVCNKRAYEYILSEAKKSAVDPKSVLLRYHGIDPETLPFKPRVRNENAPRKIKILNNARLAEKKGHKYLFEALHSLIEQGLEVELSLVSGAGELTDWARNYIIENRLQNYINLVNDGRGVPFNQISHLYESCDLFVYAGFNTDKGDSDGIANVLIESAFSGLPIISADCGATTEFLTPGVDAEIVSQKNASEIVRAVKLYISDPQKFENYAKNARQKAETMFDLTKSVSELKSLF